ncbi:hypothetical protein [Pseudomonas putida]|uniref:Uncharacterized protein n=1 Tax=Pseudomonas putida TaxID=303 RepID=A0A8I1EAW6_PSEPU|nr:hypothetical protein [Pseudomonas putida]MBI6883110.1 hypothetical protein [Pseudomonas putida]
MDKQLDFATLDFELNRLEGSSILDSKTRQAIKDAAFVTREVRSMAGVEGNVTADLILKALRERMPMRSTSYTIEACFPWGGSIDSLKQSLQAVYDDVNRAPDGHFQIMQNSGKTVVQFSRDLSGDLDVLEQHGLALTDNTAILQLMSELELTEADGDGCLQLAQGLKTASVIGL